ncbi:MAG: CpaF family protein [Lachnospiraceae bacterium]|nr:CpaF family protein [Lachnospiraceae bacterium]
MQIDIEAAKKQICRLVVEDMDFEREMTEEEIYEAIDNALMRFEDRDNLSLTDELILRNEAYNSLRKYDVIQEYLDDEEVTEIMINGEKDIFIEKRGVIEKSKKVFESKEKLEDVIQAMVAGCNRAVNEASPIQDARLSNGERVNIVLSPIAINGPIVTIRRFPNDPITMERLVEYGSISEEASDFLKRLVESKYNIFISGGTGTGKTTFLNALSQYIPKEERIITIEDSAELQLLEAENIVRLETRNAVSDECTNITIRDLIKSALRMRPDRVIVGEVRGAEAVDMLQAMNTGHDGSLSTGHGNSAKDMISRLETMVLGGMDIPLYAIRGQIAGAIDIFVHLGRLRNRKRVVLQICEVEGFVDGEVKLRTLYEWDKDELKKINELYNSKKLKDWESFNGLS